MSMERCRCEHFSHFAKEDNEQERGLTPSGQLAHPYGMEFEHGVIEVVTDFGTFVMCRGCIDDCYSAYEKVH